MKLYPSLILNYIAIMQSVTVATHVLVISLCRHCCIRCLSMLCVHVTKGQLVSVTGTELVKVSRHSVFKCNVVRVRVFVRIYRLIWIHGILTSFFNNSTNNTLSVFMQY